jgi:hypothetical protein
MSVTLAELAIKVDATEADKGKVSLEGLAQSGTKAEKSADSLASAHDKLAAETRKASAALEQTVVAANDMQRRVVALKSSYDPFAASVDRTNKELAEANMLYKAGAISAEEFGRATTLLQAGLNGLNVAHVAGAKGAKLQAHEVLNLSRQFADIGVTAAMGMNPLMILIQQGPQIADIMKTSGLSAAAFATQMGIMAGILRAVPPAQKAVAAAEAQVTAVRVTSTAATEAAAAATAHLAAAEAELAAVMSQSIRVGVAQAQANVATAASAHTAAVAAAEQAAANVAVTETATAAAVAQRVALAPLAVALGAIAAVLGTVVGGFLLLNRELSKGYPDDITKGLHLTEEQLERVKSKSVTMGDTFKATLDVMGKYLMEGPLGDAFKWLSDAWNATLDFITKAAFEGTARLIGLFIGAYRTIRDNWRNFPAVMKDAFAMAVNGAVDAIQKMVNASIKGINAAKDAASAFNPLLRLIPDVPEQDLSRFKLSVSSAFEFIEKSAAANVEQATEEVRTGMRKIGSEIQARALEIARARALAEAGKPNKGRATKDKAEEDPLFAELEDRIKRMRELARQWDRAVKDLKPIADVGLTFDAHEAQVAADAAGLLADEMGRVADASRDMANSMADGFGKAGQALGGLIDTLGTFQERQSAVFAKQAQDLADLAKARAEASKLDPAERRAAEAEAQSKWTRERIKSERDLRQAETERNIDAIRGVKSLLSQKSAAYKILTGLEVALQAIQLAGHIKELAMSAVSTAVDIANTIKRIAVKGTEAVINAMRSIPFPLNLAAAAATAAAVIAFGGKLLGGGGGGGSAGTPAEERQKTQGTGSVLGDSAAKSESIARSLDIVADNTNRDLEYSNSMLRSLRSIDSHIGTLTAALARQLGVGGAFDTSSLGLGTSRGLNTGALAVALGPIGLALSQIPVIGGIIKSLFGTKKTTTLLDQGLSFDPQSLEAILNGGLSGSSYQDIQTKTKKKAFGITYSNKTKTSTTETPLEDDILAELQRVVSSLGQGVLAAAGALGVTGAEAALNAFTVDLGKISFKDKTGAEIQEELNAVFSKLGDQMSAAIFPEIAEFQKAGEGAFETLVRIARQTQVVDVTLKSIGQTLDATGLSGIRAKDSLVQLFGSLDDFVDQTSFFAEHFLSEAERMKPIQSAVQAEFQRLGVTGVNTKDQFKQLVLGLDLTTQAGQEMYAALLSVAPAFAKVFEYLNPDAANDTADAWKSVFESMQDWIRELNGEIAGSVRSTAQAYAALQAAALAARGGDSAAAGQVVDLGKAYLSSVKSSATSQFEYLRAVAQVRAIASSVQLTAANQAGIATGAGSSTPFSPATSATGSTAPSYTYTPIKPGFATGGAFTVGGSGAGDTQNFGPVNLSPGEVVNVSRRETMAEVVAELKALKAELASLRGVNEAGFTTMSANTARTAKQLEEWDGAGLPPEREDAA